MDEIWVLLKFGHTDREYQISTLGRFKALPYTTSDGRNIKEKITTGTLNKGYLYVSVGGKQSKKNFAVHRLVAETFLPNSENKKDVNHLNGHKQDNRAANLEWVTRSENNIHARNLGLSTKGSDTYNAKLTEEKVLDILQQVQMSVSDEEIAEVYGVSRATIYKIRTGKSWKHIERPPL